MPESRPALFLDRDGVINEDLGYVHERSEVRFVDGIFELVRFARSRGFATVVVTNQAGIGRGLYTESQFHGLMDWMRSEFAARGGELTAVFHCPFHPVHGVGSYRRESGDRKPAPGMILRAVREMDLDLKRSVLVGDKTSDMLAACAAGVRYPVLLGGDGRDKRWESVRSLEQVLAVLDRLR